MNKKSTGLQAIVYVLLLLVVGPAWGFGKTGHRVVAQIAENHLDEATLAKVSKITKGAPLAKLANWPDFIRSNPAFNYASPWHYMTLPDNVSIKDYHPPIEGDVLTAIAHYEAILRNKHADAEQQWQALAYYVHLLGDLHQPLHVGRGDDRGGNDVKVLWFWSESNLHSVWDSGLIDQTQLSYSEYVSFLGEPDAATLKQWLKSDYWDWALESRALRHQAYEFGEQKGDGLPSLNYRYVYANQAIVDQRLLQAGVRLAAKLKAILQ